MRKRRIIARRQSRWTAAEWERGWDSAMTRIHGVPTTVEQEPIVQDCLTVLNAAFADGSRLRFEFGLTPSLTSVPIKSIWGAVGNGGKHALTS
jgi:hypothetical protein